MAGVVPSAGQPFQSWMHWLAHFVAFAVLAFAWKCGLPQVPAWIVAIGTVAFGFAHEAIEIVGHSHAFEPEDALVDAAGAIAGVLLACVPIARFAQR